LPKQIPREAVAALTEAVRELEACSCAEVVVEVRSRSGSYAHADARFAALLAFLALIALLFSPWPVAPWWVVLDVAVAYLLGMLIAKRSDGVRRLMTSERERAAQVRTVASSVFFERGVANTENESGVVIYHGMLERRIEILADRGVLLAVPALEWNTLKEGGRDARPGRAGRPPSFATLVDIVRALRPLLEQHLPLREGDRDELANAPRFEIE
jgi:putative membrane protein